MLNTLTLAMDGISDSDTIAEMLSNANLTFTIIFAVEMGLKLVGYGPISN